MPAKLEQAVSSLTRVNPVESEGAITNQKSRGDAPPLCEAVPHAGASRSGPQPRPLHNGTSSATHASTPSCRIQAL
eukprot:1539425-Pyramimonas_sp.AAC.1